MLDCKDSLYIWDTRPNDLPPPSPPGSGSFAFGSQAGERDQGALWSAHCPDIGVQHPIMGLLLQKVVPHGTVNSHTSLSTWAVLLKVTLGRSRSCTRLVSFLWL